MIRFDHIVIGAESLESGNRWIRQTCGIEIPAGGRHLQMATHNLVTATGLDTYLEVIAKDPEVAAPKRPRWFGLDDRSVAERLAASPFPLAWVASTDELDAACARARSVGVDVGRPLSMTRDNLRWRIAVRDDGAPCLGGAAPMIMEWPTGAHPACGMTDLGVRIRKISIATHYSGKLTALFNALGLAERPDVTAAFPDSGVPASRLAVELLLPGAGTCVLS